MPVAEVTAAGLWSTSVDLVLWGRRFAVGCGWGSAGGTTISRAGVAIDWTGEVVDRGVLSLFCLCAVMKKLLLQ